jgi:general secretion pathway protein I
MCAENALVRIRLSKQMPGVGDTETECEQAGHTYRVKLVVRPTPNSNFRRVDARVLDGDTPILSLSTVVGRN